MCNYSYSGGGKIRANAGGSGGYAKKVRGKWVKMKKSEYTQKTSKLRKAKSSKRK